METEKNGSGDLRERFQLLKSDSAILELVKKNNVNGLYTYEEDIIKILDKSK